VFFGSWTVYPVVTGLALWGGLVIGAVYMTRAVRNVLHGPLPEKWAGLADASSLWRKLPYALLLASLFVFGCFPRLLTEKITPDARRIVSLAAPVQSTAKAGMPTVLSEIRNPKSEIRN
jgi:NADH:ubiquinone oxidoreductase subunit 4 (subunit M)